MSKYLSSFFTTNDKNTIISNNNNSNSIDRTTSSTIFTYIRKQYFSALAFLFSDTRYPATLSMRVMDRMASKSRDHHTDDNCGSITDNWYWNETQVGSRLCHKISFPFPIDGN